MSHEPCNVDPLDVLNSINYIDSALFGLSIDLFKIRLWINVQLSYDLRKFGFEKDHGYICFDFRQIENLDLKIKRSLFGPPYLEDGELAAGDLVDFDFECIDLKKVGSTGQTDRLGEYGELRDIHKVRMPFRGGGALQFQFVSLEMSIFDPLDFDRKR